MTSIAARTCISYLDDLAAHQATPAGVTAAAMAGSQAAALLSMVIRFTLGRLDVNTTTETQRIHHREDLHQGLCRDSSGRRLDAAGEAEMQRHLQRSEALRHALLTLADADMQAYGAVTAAYAMPKTTPDAITARRAAIQHGLKEATQTPLAIAEQCLEVIRQLQPVAEQANPNVISDGATALYLAHSALQSALLALRVNLRSIRDGAFVADWSARSDALEEQVATAYAAALLTCEARLHGAH